jgi:hypothetical protein
MLPSKKEVKELTEQQQSFINALFGEAQGNPKKAGEIAGLALNSAKAVKGLVDALDEDGKTPGVNIRMEAAKQILDRVGLVKKDKIDINAQVAHGIFILPPKDATN